MDYLDPRKRRSHSHRLVIGYILVAIAIGLATIILVYGAYGYGIDTKTGDIVENGLLFTGSKPGGAEIYLNGKDQNKQTSARLVLPAGKYNLILKKDGYRQWQRDFTLEEHSVARYVYPFLFPIDPKTTAKKTYASAPVIFTQSPSRRWLLVSDKISETGGIDLDQYDTTNVQSKSNLITIPRTIFNPAAKLGKFKVIEWTSDNNFFLLRHDFKGGFEFLAVNRRTPQNSVNLNRLFKFNPDQVVFRDKKPAQYYLYQKKTLSIRVGVAAGGELRPAFLKNVLAFKPFGASLISYVADQSSQTHKVEARIWDNGETYPFYSFPAGRHYLIDAAQYQGHWYYVAGSNTTDRINIFKDPLDTLPNPDIANSPAIASLRVKGATKVSFSNNTRFITVQAGDRFGVYDLEQLERFQYSNPFKSTTEVSWMDGHRLIGTNKNKVIVFDFDASNPQQIAPTNLSDGGLFSSDFNQLYTTVPDKKTAKSILNMIDMRAGSDLPASL